MVMSDVNILESWVKAIWEIPGTIFAIFFSKSEIISKRKAKKNRRKGREKERRMPLGNLFPSLILSFLIHRLGHSLQSTS